jgi:5-methylcytosine-specific restriction protein A
MDYSLIQACCAPGPDQVFLPWTLSNFCRARAVLNHFTTEIDDVALSRERQKARELRGSQWWKRQLARGQCHYCGRSFSPEALTMDHIVPMARGGKSTKGNVVPACKACNNKKKYMLPIEWEEYLQSLTENGVG